jgi:hypothetical protein
MEINIEHPTKNRIKMDKILEGMDRALMDDILASGEKKNEGGRNSVMGDCGWNYMPKWNA